MIQFIEFHLLKPEEIVKIFKPDFSLDDIAKGATEYAEDLEDLSILIIALMFVMIFGIVMSLIYLVPKLRDTATTKIKDFKKNLFFNGLIRTI